jgi:hypothetical protein
MNLIWDPIPDFAEFSIFTFHGLRRQRLDHELGGLHHELFKPRIDANERECGGTALCRAQPLSRECTPMNAILFLLALRDLYNFGRWTLDYLSCAGIWQGPIPCRCEFIRTGLLVAIAFSTMLYLQDMSKFVCISCKS